VTSQPYTPQSESRTEPPADSSVAPDTRSELDPDIVVLDDDDVEEVPRADEASHADESDKAVATAGMTASQADGMTAPQDSSVLTEPASNEPGRNEPARNEPDLSEQWHDIQAMFVDDPQGSVDRAAAAADDAVSALVETLRRRLSAGPACDLGDTEQLRSTLRSYRDFCQRVADLDEELLQASPMAR
jgi:hypothetical protein